MSSARFPPRNLPFEDLVSTLIDEHRKMRELLRKASEAAARNDFEDVSSCLRLLDPIFRQHIADEEAQVLRLLIGQLGRKGAEEEVKVFQQHRPIYGLMLTVSELASKQVDQLRLEQVKLHNLFDEHARAEEGRVFPRALACFSEKDRL